MRKRILLLVLTLSNFLAFSFPPPGTEREWTTLGTADLRKIDVINLNNYSGVKAVPVGMFQNYEITDGSGTTPNYNGIVDLSTLNYSSDYITFTIVNSFGSAPYSKLIKDPIPVTPNKPTGNSTACGLEISTYTVSAVDWADSYEWIIENGGTIKSGQGSRTITVEWNKFEGDLNYIKVRVKNKHSEYSGYSSLLYVDVSPRPADATVPTGDELITTQNSSNYTVSPITNATSYSWWLDPSTAGTIMGTSTTGTAVWNLGYQGDVDVYVRGISCGNGNSNHLTVTINPHPGKASQPTGLTDICENSSNTSYTTSASNATSYEWQINSEAGIITGTSETVIVNWNNTYHGTVQIRARGVNTYGNGEWSDYLTFSINPKPEKASTPTGVSSICQDGANSNFSTSGATYADSYNWDIEPSTAGTITGTSTTATVNWTNNFYGTATIKVRGVNNCSNGDWSNEKSVVVSPIAFRPNKPDGNTEVCQSGTDIYTSSGSANSTSWHWDLDPSDAGTIVLNGNQTADINWASDYSSTVELRVRGENSCGNSSYSNILYINVTNLPETAAKPVGEANPCQGSIYIFNTAGATYANDYEWIVTPVEAASNISGTSSSISITFSTSYTGTAQVEVRGINDCGNGSYSSPKSIYVEPLPLKAAKPAGDIEVCQGTSSSVYTTTGATYADSYEWFLDPAEAGSISGTTKNATISWNSGFTGVTTIKVRGLNDCGEGTWSDNLTIQRDPLPGKAWTPTGQTTVCQGTNTVSYTTSGATDAISYEWSIEPVNAGIITGFTTTANIDWDNDYSGSANVRVRAINDCGNGVWSDYIIIIIDPLPDNPETPTGEPNPCQGDTYQYSVVDIDNANSYNWEIIPNEAGTITGSTKIVNIEFAENYISSAEIKVRGVNNCGNGSYSSSHAVTINPTPLKADKPSGDVEICEDIAESECSTTGADYATSYSWNIKPITAGSIVGSGFNATIYWNTDFIGKAMVFVRGVNSCNNGEYSDTLYVERTPLPVKPVKPIGQNSVCQNIGDVIYYTTAVDYANDYEWKIDPVNAGSIIGTGNSIMLRYNENYSGMCLLYIRGINTCGYGDWSDALIIDVNPLPIVALNSFSDKCGNGADFTLTGGYPSGGYYSWLSETITKFDPQEAGVGPHTIRYTVTNVDGCTNYDESIINVLEHLEKPEINNATLEFNNNYVWGIAENILQININEPNNQYFWYSDVSCQNLVAVGSSMITSTLPNTLDNLTYYVKAYDDICYSDVQTVKTKSVLKPSTPTINGVNTVCRNDTVILIAQRQNSPTDEYIYKSRWCDQYLNILYEGDTLELPYSTEKQIYLSTVDSVFTNSGYFINESDKSNITVSISNVEKPTINIDNLYCKSSNIELNAISGTNTIIWYDNNMNKLCEGNTYIVYDVQNNSTYYTTAKNTLGCESESAQANINIQSVEAIFTADVTNISIGGKVQFTNSSTNAEYYTWNFGDGSDVINTESPEHYYYTSGTYDIQLIVKSNIECLDTLTKTEYITVTGNTTGIEDTKAEFKIYPNPFKNSFVIENHKTEEITINIYNLTGKKIFTTLSNKSKIFIDITEQSIGLYLVEIKSSEHKIIKKLIKR